MIAPDQKPIFAIYYQMFIRILKEYQLYYHDFIGRFQHCSATAFPSLLELQEFTDSTNKIDSFGIMSLKSPIFPSRTNESVASDSFPSNQFLSVWIPSQWNHSFYSQKCEILVSNVIYPIEEFLKNSSNCDSSFSSEQELLRKLEALDDLAIPKEDGGSSKAKKTQNKANKKTKEGILTFKNSFQLLLSSYDNAKHQNDPSLLILMEVEIMKMIQRIFIQRFEILYPLMKEFYAPKNDGGSSVPLSVLNDFDSIYYCHQHPGKNVVDHHSRNEARNPFRQYSLENQQLKQQKQLQHLEKLLTEMDTQAKKSEKSSAAKGKKAIEDVAVATSGKKSSPGASSTPAAVKFSSAKAEKRPLLALYDTPTIGADWNPSLLKEHQHQQFSQQLVNREEEEGETKSYSPHNNNAEGEEHQRHHFEESQKKRKKNEVFEEAEQQQQQQLLKEKVAQQKKSSRKFLEFLEQQIMN
jgi:hypothetical protein